MKRLYHITKKKYISSIFYYGLIPNKCRGISTYSSWKYKPKAIWLTNNPGYIIDTQLTPNWIEDAIMLKVDVTELDVEQYMSYAFQIPKIIPFEFIVRNTIDPNLISI
jgi:hypothetical protein